ncbi:MAG: hypothetical protein SFU25_10085 [Candidatus Caenarcaniphilales bacterium]|nr:hypothetical protein [Candidatus Caenarcaniphilales bacterium]
MSNLSLQIVFNNSVQLSRNAGLSALSCSGPIKPTDKPIIVHHYKTFLDYLITQRGTQYSFLNRAKVLLLDLDGTCIPPKHHITTFLDPIKRSMNYFLDEGLAYELNSLIIHCFENSIDLLWVSNNKNFQHVKDFTNFLHEQGSEEQQKIKIQVVSAEENFNNESQRGTYAVYNSRKPNLRNFIDKFIINSIANSHSGEALKLIVIGDTCQDLKFAEEINKKFSQQLNISFLKVRTYSKSVLTELLVGVYARYSLIKLKLLRQVQKYFPWFHSV